MIEYNVFVDRRRKSPKMGDNSLHLPFAKEGRLWRDIIRFTRYAPSRVLDERIWDIIDVTASVSGSERYFVVQPGDYPVDELGRRARTSHFSK